MALSADKLRLYRCSLPRERFFSLFHKPRFARNELKLPPPLRREDIKSIALMLGSQRLNGPARTGSHFALNLSKRLRTFSQIRFCTWGENLRDTAGSGAWPGSRQGSTPIAPHSLSVSWTLTAVYRHNNSIITAGYRHRSQTR